MTAIHLEKTAPPPINDRKEGAYYDSCPSDGCMEVDPMFKNGGIDNHGYEHFDWSMYNADRKKGGCGTTWTRTSEQGRQLDASKGINTKWLTGSAAKARTYILSPDNEAYSEGYRRAFGHD